MLMEFGWRRRRMDKPTPEAVAAFEGAVPDDPRVVLRKMFGMPAATVNGNLFLGVYGPGVVLRLPEAGLAAVRALQGVGAFRPGGREWKAYALALGEVWGGTEQLRGWAREALDHTATLPPK
jgi:hypothetical protein